MWRRDERGVELKDAVQAFKHLRSRAQQAIKDGDRQGIDLRTHRVKLRDEAGNLLFEGTLAQAATLQFGSDGPPPAEKKKARPPSSDLLTPGVRPMLSDDEAQAQLTELDPYLLKVSRQHLYAIAKATSDVCYRMSADWSEMRTLSGNGFIADMSNPRQSWLDLYIPPDDQGPVLAGIETAIRAKSVFNLEHRVFRVDGSLGWTRSCAVPILAPDGRIIEWIGSADDITDRRQAETTGVRSRVVRAQLDATYVLYDDLVRGVIESWAQRLPEAAAALLETCALDELATLMVQRLTEVGSGDEK